MKFGLLLLIITNLAYGQAIYDANGQYRAYSQTSSSGVTTAYSPQGQTIGFS